MPSLVAQVVDEVKSFACLKPGGSAYEAAGKDVDVKRRRNDRAAQSRRLVKLVFERMIDAGSRFQTALPQL